MIRDETGTSTTLHEEEGKLIVRYEQDVEAVIKANHEQMVRRSRVEKKGDFHHVMRVPTVILQKICQETGLDFFNKDDAKQILEILKRPEYAAFRTYPGQI
jgi:hypothetical protein